MYVNKRLSIYRRFYLELLVFLIYLDYGYLIKDVRSVRHALLKAICEALKYIPCHDYNPLLSLSENKN